MDPESLQVQAARLEALLPRLMRRMFTLEPGSLIHEMPLAQLRVCSILQSGPRTLSAVSEELSVSVSAATQIADRMERAGLVERTAGTDDRRTKYLQLTPHGQELMRNRRSIRVKRVEQALSQMLPEVRQTLLQSVERLLEAAILTTPELLDNDPIGVRQEQG